METVSTICPSPLFVVPPLAWRICQPGTAVAMRRLERRSHSVINRKGVRNHGLRVEATVAIKRASDDPETAEVTWTYAGTGRFALTLGPRYLPTTRLTTMAAMPASTALAIGDDRMSVIGLADACC